MLSSAGAVVLAVGYVLPLVYLIWSLFWGRRAPATIPGTRRGWSGAPPRRRPREEFPTPPRVDVGPYDYHPEGMAAPDPTSAIARAQGDAGMSDARRTPILQGALARPRPPARGRDLRHLGLSRQRTPVLRRAASGLYVYRIENPQAFAAAARETDICYGTVNTAVLLTSSLTMAIAAQGAEAKADFRRLIVWCLAATAALGLTFADPERA